MRKGRRRTTPFAPRKPADASAGAPFVRKFLLKLFDREDGKAADWPLIAETLLQEALYALDQSPADPRTASLLRQASGAFYERLIGDQPDDISHLQKRENRAGDSFNPQAAPGELPEVLPLGHVPDIS